MSSTRTQWILELQDKLSAPLRKIRSATESTRTAMSKAQSVSIGTSSALNRVKNTGTGAAGANKQLARTSNHASTGLRSIRNAAIGAFGALAVFKGVKSIARLGLDMEQTRVAFATFLRDAAKANHVIDRLNEFSNITPFNNREVIQSGRQLLAANIPAEQLIQTLKNVGDVAAGADVPLNEMAAIYAKAMNKGRIQAEELNQLSERGVPVLQVFADMFGITTAQVMKMGSEGKLTSSLMQQAFEKMSDKGGMFYDMMKKQSETAGGTISTLTGKLQTIAISIGEMLLPVIKTLVNGLITMIDWMKRNATMLKVVTVAVASGTAAYVTYHLWIKRITLATKIWTAIQKALNWVMRLNPIGLIITAIVALIGAIVYVIKKTDGWGKQWDSIINFLKLSWEAFVEQFRFLWNAIQNAFMIGINKMKKAWYKFRIVMGIGDVSKNREALNNIQRDMQARQQAIVEGARKVMALNKKANAALTWELKWKKDVKISDITEDIKKKIGIPVTLNVDSNRPAGIDDTMDRGYIPNSKSIKDKIFPGIDNETQPILTASGTRGVGKSITMNLDITNNFNLHPGSWRDKVDEIADYIVGKLNDRMKDSIIALQ